MKTRRSKKSFEMVPPKKRNRKTAKQRIVQNVVEETIVLSDSEEEVQLDNEDDIQVIDVAEASNGNNTPVEGLETILSSSKIILPQTPPALPEPELNVNPPVIDIDDEPDQNDDDGIEVVGFVFSGKRSSRSMEKRVSLNRKSNGGSNSRAMELLTKAKNVLRRSTSSSSNVAFAQNNLNKISAQSRHIRRNNKKWQNRIPMGGENFRGRNRNAMLHNRTRENNRQVIFRPMNNQVQNNIPFGASNFSFEVNPFAPCSTSTPAFRRNDEGIRWVQKRRGGHRPRPAPIAPGSNIMNVGGSVARAAGSLRPVVIDGSNVAVGHGGLLPGGGNKFSARGIRICVEYFKKRGHKEIVVFVPRFRLKKSECRDPELLEEMEREGHVRFTPSREAGGQRIASYDDLFVVEYAHETGGIIISNDNFRDLYDKKPHLQDAIKFRLMQYTWITQDVIMFPEDPLGRSGPSLDQFLCF